MTTRERIHGYVVGVAVIGWLILIAGILKGAVIH